MQGDIHVYRSEEGVFRAGAERFLRLAQEAVAERGAFHVALAGGSTPKGMYRLLADAEYRERVPWPQVHVWFGDERCVPPEHEQSNFRMARETLLAQVPIPENQVHRMQGELPPEQGAKHYAETLCTLLGGTDGVPRLDLILLGTGPDGHTASLFPGTDILGRRRPVAAVYVQKLGSWRLSLTYPVLNAARHLLLLVAGPAKADVMRHVFGRRENTNPLPVQRLRPNGTIAWLLDSEAARHLPLQPEG